MPAPTRLGKYELRRELGKGSMGVVYEAFDPIIERLVAIKIIRQDDFGTAQTAELIARLRREAQAAGRLNHPGIVSVYDFGEDATAGGHGIAYIAMELVDGRELKDLLDSGRRFTPAEAVRILGEVLGALQHAHERGVTHRDIKPGNVILLADGGVKLADFGVARLEKSELTQAGTLIGTPMYMSPEQILGLEVDGRSDLFSCGVLLYELLTGRKPFTGSVTTVMQKVLNVDPEPPSRANTALGTDWDALLQRALAKKPEDRFPSARAFAQAMRETLARHGDEATVVMVPPSVPASPPSYAPPASTEPRPSETARPARRGGTVLAAGVIALAGAAGLYALLRPAPPSDVATRTSAAPAAPTQPAASGAAASSAAGGPSTTPPSASAAAPSAPATVPPAAPTPRPRPAPGAPPPPPSPPPTRPATPPPATTPATAPKPIFAPAPAPAPSASVAPRPTTAPSRPAVAPAPVPPPVAPANDWPARVARINKLKADTPLTQALRRLLDPLSASEAQTMADFEALLRGQPASTGLAMGIKNGYFHYWWVRGAAGPASAGASARKRCEERHGTTCHPVLVDGALQPEGFTAAARALGAQPPDAVRAALLQAFALSLVNARQAAAASGATPAASTPAAGWAAARAQLRAPGAPQDLAGALSTLLQVDSPADLALLARLQTFVKRRPWNSALAMGVRGGHITWHGARARSAWTGRATRRWPAATPPRPTA